MNEEQEIEVVEEDVIVPAPKKREPKTIFEHMGIAQKGGGIDWNKSPMLAKLKGFAIMIGIGFVIGMMLDIFYGTSIATYLCPLGFVLIILIRMYRDDKEKHNV